jgi:hypothetical protein
MLAPVEFLSLYLPSLDTQVWSGSASLFRVTAVTALLLMVYFALRVANQEFAPWRFKPVFRWMREQGISPGSVEKAQLAFLSLYVGLSLLLCLPLLIWAGAIARTPLSSVAVTLLLLWFYALCYSVWGLVSLVLWERRARAARYFIRCFFFGLVLPRRCFICRSTVAFLLAVLNRQELAPLVVAGSKWSATTVHFAFHLLIGATGLAAHRWALRRESGS